MAAEIKIKQLTRIDLGPDTLNPLLDGTINLTNVANGVAIGSAALDLGTTQAVRYLVRIKTKFTSAPTAALTCPVYVAFNDAEDSGWPSTLDYEGGVWPADGNESEWAMQLQFIGNLVCTNDVTQDAMIGSFEPQGRYCIIVVNNTSGQAMTNVDTDHVLTLMPRVYESQ